MAKTHNRDSPRLRFTREELEESGLSLPAEEVPKPAAERVALKKKPKARYKLKPAKEKAGTEPREKTPELSDRVSSEHSPDSLSMQDREEIGGVQTDPRAPGVRNTRKSVAARTGSGKATAAAEANGADPAPPGIKGKDTFAAVSKGKNSTGLKFEETQAKKPSKLAHPVEKTIRSAGDQMHRQVARSNEDDNVAVDAVLQADNVKESALQAGEHAYHAKKLRSHRQTEQQAEQPGIRVQKTGQQRENPQFTSNPYSRWQQKKSIRREYAAAKRGKGGKAAQQTAKKTEKAAEKAGDAAEKTAEAIRRHPSVLVILALGALLMIVMSSLQSCTLLMTSVSNTAASGTYPAEESDVRAAEQAYLAKEKQLKNEMEHYEQYHPGYDEYHVKSDEIWHDPYVLMAIISASFNGEEWDLEKANPIIEKYFRLQYSVKETLTSETRYRTETMTGTRTVKDPRTGRIRTETYTYEAEVPYTYTVCNVTLENRNLSHLPVENMSQDTLSMYAMYMSTHGNMDGIFTGPHASTLKEPMLYDIPQETLDADPVFARLMEEASAYIGYPYVWGGSTPETSFDCSGFICYVFTSSGVYNTGRLGAKGLRSLCRNVSADQVKPGDIVFFEGTMGDGVSGVTHCGIYVGNNMMIHCGDPISYASLNDSYWKQHFHSYGRVPN